MLELTQLACTSEIPAVNGFMGVTLNWGYWAETIPK